MNTDLNISNSLRQGPSPAAAQATAKQAAAAPAQVAAAPVVQAPVKVKLQIDPEQSRKNVLILIGEEAGDGLNRLIPVHFPDCALSWEPTVV
jgi:hypothetical protein